MDDVDSRRLAAASLLGSAGDPSSAAEFAAAAERRWKDLGLNASASRRIVVGSDGSGASDAALEFACQRAEATGERAVVLHACPVAVVR